MHTTASSLVAIAQYFWRICTSLFFVYQQKFNIEAWKVGSACEGRCTGLMFLRVLVLVDMDKAPLNGCRCIYVCVAVQGNAMACQGQYVVAVECFTKAIQLDSSDYRSAAVIFLFSSPLFIFALCFEQQQQTCFTALIPHTVLKIDCPLCKMLDQITFELRVLKFK